MSTGAKAEQGVRGQGWQGALWDFPAIQSKELNNTLPGRGFVLIGWEQLEMDEKDVFF